MMVEPSHTEPTGRELAIDVAGLRAWIMLELKHLDERLGKWDASKDHLELLRVAVEALRVEIAAMHRLMDERHALYAERDSARKEAVQAALVAQEKLVNAAFAASKEAILKAEESQKGVNERSNEFRGQLADQAGTLMPRKEAEASMSDLRDRIERNQALSVGSTDELSRTWRAALDDLKREMRNENDKLLTQITGLRESRSEGTGRQSQQTEGRGANQWAISAAIALAALLVGALGTGALNRQPPAPPIIIQSPTAPNAIGGGSVTDSKSTTRTQP